MERTEYADQVKDMERKQSYIEQYLFEYLSQPLPIRKRLEYEIRFGKRKYRYITKSDFENVISRLKELGFQFNYNQHLLRVSSNNHDIRTEICGLNGIQYLCKTEEIDSFMKDDVKREMIMFNEKTRMKTYPMRDYNSFGFRVSLQEETEIDETDNRVKQVVSLWEETPKTFRLMNRLSASHPEWKGIRVDLSVVKSNIGNVREHRTIKQSNVFQSRERYEIELEYENLDEALDVKNVYREHLGRIKRVVSYILQGLQETIFPISYDEMTKVEQEYLKMFKVPKEGVQIEDDGDDDDKDNGDDDKEDEPKVSEIQSGGSKRETKKKTMKQHIRRNTINPNSLATYRITPSDFIGPSSVSLEQKHILPSTNGVTLLEDYTVTDKADGKRKLLFISSEGKMYFVTSGMKFQFTGYMSNLKNTVMDGEHILHDKSKKSIHLYAVFDVYVVNGIDIRKESFIQKIEKEESSVSDDKDATMVKTKASSTSTKDRSRFGYMSTIMKHLEMYPVNGANNAIHTPLRVEKKTFYQANVETSIFRQSKYLLDIIENGGYNYETDGLIYTPAYKGVALNPKGGVATRKVTWRESFKWKPAEFNSIDFLVKVVKENDTERIRYTANKSDNSSGSGSMSGSGSDVSSYKTLILNVGYDETNKEHGIINPCKSMLNGEDISVDYRKTGVRHSDRYRPTPFTPTSPSDEEAMICNIELRDEVMYTEDDEVIKDNMIIECRYDKSRGNGWKWVPMRVRYDKTAELQRGIKQFGNAYNVANSIWHSIHHPITPDMIKGIEPIDVESSNESVYYNRNEMNHTQSLRSFHNLFVKSQLIRAVSPNGGNLLDLAVGKAGDLSKWRLAKLGFVLGIDISQDNIENRTDGACVRYLRLRANQQGVPDCIFLQGKSHERVKDGSAMFTDKGREVIKALYGFGARDRNKLDKQVYTYYGVGKSGFNVVSCQFAIHYFFANKSMLETFIQNVSEGCALNGYFVGTTYDGETLFEELENKKRGEGISEFIGEHKIWEVKKAYDKERFGPDESSLGMAIDVYQESINQTLTEYLVHFDYFKSLMADYGFILLERNEARDIGLPNSTGMFKELFQAMETEVNRDVKERGEKKSRKHQLYKEAMKLNQSDDASQSQRRISYLNRYFVFKKIRDHNFKTISIKDSILEEPDKQMGETNGKELVTEVNPDALMSVSSKQNQLENQRLKKQDILTILSEEQTNKRQYERFVSALKQISFGCHKGFSDKSFLIYIRQLYRDDANRTLTDYEIYQRYMDYMKNDMIPKTEDVEKAFDRGENRSKLIQGSLSMARVKDKTILDKVETYLDYGCGDGEITRSVQKKLGLDPKNVHCSDIKQYPSLVNMQFIKSEYGSPLKLEDNTMDLITSHMVLHHIDDKYLEYVLRDLYRIMKPGGVLLIREHDAPTNLNENQSFHKVIDVTHDVYDYVIEAEMSWKDKDDYYAKYRPVNGMNGWDETISRVGFKPTTYQKKTNRDIQTNPNATCIRMYYKPGFTSEREVKTVKRKTTGNKSKTEPNVTRKKWKKVST